MHTLSPETDNCPSWISGKERMTIENISWSISAKECCRPRRGLNPRLPGLQSDGASNWATEPGSTPWLFNRPKPYTDRFLNRPAPYTDQFPNRPAPYTDRFLNRPAPYMDWLLNLPALFTYRFLNRPALYMYRFLNRPAPYRPMHLSFSLWIWVSRELFERFPFSAFSWK